MGALYEIKPQREDASFRAQACCSWKNVVNQWSIFTRTFSPLVYLYSSPRFLLLCFCFPLVWTTPHSGSDLWYGTWLLFLDIHMLTLSMLLDFTFDLLSALRLLTVSASASAHSLYCLLS
ncbi:hypothetical protein QQF64_008021 [Cirrhinus molitorella]|uniref:Uncharacterized protein n=1 Tax=Cirrhinus molitorella TaxID=172907 RepID=A0ABR3M4Y9_9TELE